MYLLYKADVAEAGEATDVVAPATCVLEQADLVYVSYTTPGVSRRKRGKRWHYFLPSGVRLTDAEEVARIDALAIPPAYSDVWICPRADGHLQAVGTDARKRRQYRYHPRWAEARDRAKFEKLGDFARALPGLRRRIARDLDAPGLGREKVLAACITLLDTLFLRVGNSDYTRANGSYGLTTLRDEHATIRGGTIRLRYRGKSGVDRQLRLDDPRLARIVKKCQDLPGQELLQWVDPAGNVRDVGSGDVNARLQEVMGDAFSAKDFRTWHATCLAADALRGETPGGTKSSINKQVVAAVDGVAGRLGNTRSVCRKCYVWPGVFEAFEAGTLNAAFAETPRKAGLSSTERAVLGLLTRPA